MQAGILVVSDTAARQPETDKASSALESVLGQDPAKWAPARVKIVKDGIAEIQAALLSWTDNIDDSVNLIVTTGGTGFAASDVTPEAVRPLLQKHATGLVHAMLTASLAITPFASMSRPVAGVRNSTLIVTLPGSPKGAQENLQAILKLLPHACEQIAGGNSRALHAGGVERLEVEAGFTKSILRTSSDTPSNMDHSHSCAAHGHHTSKHTVGDRTSDPGRGPAQRHRSSPFPMLSVENALKEIDLHCVRLPPVSRNLDVNICGHVLSRDVIAAESVPAFRASIVDGYAVKFDVESETNPAGTFPVAFVSHAQVSTLQAMDRDSVVRITTGAALPEGADAVVMVEDTLVKSTNDDGTEEVSIDILTDKVRRGENVREIGSDTQKGTKIMSANDNISATGGELGLLIAAGLQQVEVFRKPRVGVLSTGDEVRSHETVSRLEPGQIRDTNRPTLVAAITAQGFEVVDLGIASDKSKALDSILRNGLEQVDVIVTTGGVSMGELDLLKPTIERELGGQIHFGRVSMKPGKPTTFATIPTAHGRKLVFSLPGNPASAVVTFMIFVLPALQKMSGQRPSGLPKVPVRLDTEFRCDASRDEYHRVAVVYRDGDPASGLWAISTGNQRSSRIGSFYKANALVRTPAGKGSLEKGMLVEALLMTPMVEAER